jgi:hypothetical protein
MQPPRAGAWKITELISWECGWCTKLNCPTLLGEELTGQSCGCGVTNLLPGKNSNISDHHGQSGNEQPQTSIANCLEGRRIQLLFTSQTSAETSSEIPPVSNGLSDQGKQDLKNPIWLPIKLTKRGSIFLHRIPTLRRDRDIEKAPVISASTWIWYTRNKSRVFAKVIFLFLLLFFFFTLFHFSFFFLFFIFFLFVSLFYWHFKFYYYYFLIFILLSLSFFKFFYFFFIYSHVHTLGHFSPLMPLLPSPPFPPSVPGSTCSALISNFVEEKT